MGSTVASDTFCVLFTSVGRRSELVDLFRASAKRLGLDPVIVGANASPLAPALHFCDVAEIVPLVDDPAYETALLDIIRRHRARLVVPLIDTELGLHARMAEGMRSLGATPLISSPAAVAVAADKFDTWRFFSENGIPAPAAVALPAPADAIDGVGLPAVVKPRRGSASQDVHVVGSPAERDDIALRLAGDGMVQELATGPELTLDVLCDLDGALINVVVRERIATRGGESTIGVTVARPDVWEAVGRIVSALKPAGPITIQCFSDVGRLAFTEINARFGGGYPLAEAAGARYPELVLRMCLGESVEPRVGSYEPGVAMSRYDRSVFFAFDDGAGSPAAWTSEGDELRW
jgi:carbamoyl-phosphate synthase large subunit